MCVSRKNLFKFTIKLSAKIFFPHSKFTDTCGPNRSDEAASTAADDDLLINEGHFLINEDHLYINKTL